MAAAAPSARAASCDSRCVQPPPIFRWRAFALGPALVACLLALSGLLRADDGARPPFDVWLAEVRAEAVSRGIREEVLREVLDGLQPLSVVVERDRSQAEFTFSLDAYLRQRVTAAMVRTGRRLLARHRSLLRRVQAEYGVDAATIVSIWGLESNYGRFTGVRPTVAALATLAYEPRRAALFREELFSALEILHRGDIDAARMQGSWAGAMGQPQFMPSSYLRHAVDFDGNGRKDIWRSEADIFASIANYLRNHGWTGGERWGRRVQIPAAVEDGVRQAAVARDTGCSALRELSVPLPLADWRRLGVRLVSGQPLPAGTLSASLLRTGEHAYLVYGNYEAVLGYNCAHAYALSVTTLADRLASR
jgi:membrane-bound lytic murein transglycosylase B